MKLNWGNGMVDEVDCYSFIGIFTPFTFYNTILYDLCRSCLVYFYHSIYLLMPYCREGTMGDRVFFILE